MRVSSVFYRVVHRVVRLVHKVVQPCSVSGIPVFMRVSEFFRGLFTGLFA